MAGGRPLIKPLVACVAENSERWFAEAFNLAFSIRQFGGALASAPIVVNFVEGVAPRARELLAPLEVEIRTVSRHDPRCPPMNKLRMLDLAERDDFDVLVALDTDTLVLGDPSPYFRSDRLRAKPENHDPLTPQQWALIFDAVGMEEPPMSFVMTSTAQVTYPYFNSGVLFIPRDACLALRDTWLTHIGAMFAAYERSTVPVPRRWWTEQIAFALAVQSIGLNYELLPVSLNFSTTNRPVALYSGQIGPPFILHYHNEIDRRGFVFASRNPEIDLLIHRFNQARARALGQPYGRLPRPPRMRQLYQELERTGVLASRPAVAVRKSGLTKLPRRLVKRLARGRR